VLGKIADLFRKVQELQTPRPGTERLALTVWAAFGPYNTAEDAEKGLRRACRAVFGQEGIAGKEKWVEGHVKNFHDWHAEGRFTRVEKSVRAGLLLTAYGKAFETACHKLRVESLNEAQAALDKLSGVFPGEILKIAQHTINHHRKRLSETGEEELHSPFSWSDNPGCFERHLKRRYMNPLFPVERRRVTASQVAEAKIRDTEDAARVREEFSKIGSDVLSMPDLHLTPDQVESLRRRIDDLIEMACGVGGTALDIAVKALEAREIMMKSYAEAVKDDPRAREALQKAEDFYRNTRFRFINPFLAQRERKDTPILPEEILPSLMTEDPDTIRGCLAMISNEMAIMMRVKAEELVRSVLEQGITLPSIEEKLKALGVCIEQ